MYSLQSDSCEMASTQPRLSELRTYELMDGLCTTLEDLKFTVPQEHHSPWTWSGTRTVLPGTEEAARAKVLTQQVNELHVYSVQCSVQSRHVLMLGPLRRSSIIAIFSWRSMKTISV